MLIEIFITFLVTAERVIFDKVQTNELLEVGGTKEEEVRVIRLANVLSRHSLNESSLVTSIWNPGNVVVSESWCQSLVGVQIR